MVKHVRKSRRGQDMMNRRYSKYCIFSCTCLGFYFLQGAFDQLLIWDQCHGDLVPLNLLVTWDTGSLLQGNSAYHFTEAIDNIHNVHVGGDMILPGEVVLPMQFNHYTAVGAMYHHCMQLTSTLHVYLCGWDPTYIHAEGFRVQARSRRAGRVWEFY